MTRDHSRSARRRLARPALALLAGAFVLGAGVLLLVGGGSAPRRDGSPDLAPARPQAAAAGGNASSASAPATDVRSPGGDAEAHLAAGEDLFGRNAPGTPGATKEGLLEAQEELSAALRLGSARRLVAQRILAATYTALGEEWAETIGERLAYEERARDALRQVVAASPQDVEARLAYARTMREPAARVPELREAARLAPGDGEIRRLLGIDLLESGEVTEGARQLVEASRLFGRDAMEEHGLELLSLLHASGCEEEEARVRERIEQLGL